MNIIDLILIFIILLSIWSGFNRGFIAGITELIGLVITIYLALLIYPFIAGLIEKYLTTNSLLIIGISFLFIILVVRTLIYLLLSQLMKLISSSAFKHPVNRFLGVIPGMINGLIYAALISTLLLLFPFSESLANKIQDSKFANHFVDYVEKAESKIAPNFGEAVKRSVNNLRIETGPKDFIKLNFKVLDPVAMPELEKKMLDMVNAERKKEGLKPLKADLELRKVARKHSEDMLARSYFSHYTPEKKSPFDRINDAEVTFITAGENLSLAPNLKLAHEGLMNSPGHRANILHPSFGRLGIGILSGGRHGLMITQNFRN